MIRYRTLIAANSQAAVLNTNKVAVIMLGESNSGGYALNDTALSSELDVNSNLLLLNNTTLATLDPIKIGAPNANNMVGHVGLSVVDGVHGCDLQLSNYADQGTLNGTMCLLKAGQGGSRIEHWYNGGSLFMSTLNPWTTFLARLNAYKTLIPANSICPIILFLGINDAIAGTDPALFKSHTLSFIEELLNQVGVANYVYYVRMPRINANYIAIDNAITEMPIVNNKIRVISVDGAMDDMRDSNHFGYFGFKTTTDRIVAQIKIDYGI